MLKSGIEILQEIIHAYVKIMADAAFSWLKIYLMEPTDFEKYGFIGEMHKWIFGLSTALGILFFVYNMTKLLTQKMGGFHNRSGSEIVVKTIMGTIFATFSPFLLNEVLLKVNNAWVNFIISKGINVDTFAKFVTFPVTTNIAIMSAAFLLAIMFLILAIQYIVRLGELMILFLLAPIAAMTATNEDLNIWPIWWREAVAVVFQQSFQITTLWLIFNLLGGAKTLNDYILALALMVIVLKGPSVLRKFIYSSGSGRMAVGAAGGVAKATLFRYAATKMITR
ncbi:hypothetical protein OCO53_25630 [Peribacillus frigoritolerans]|uniref:conjugal transfer protein TrbL family protein n=1 Tax=Peribacillus frigoritolerans TaxID=450367 RepID=UPI0021D38E74|nr:conjugal transfer protein TrbL family protein [Peribacillus frigoritolerans]MCU6603825.1 hypothetical protein [Peribacillus frigoritolerans]